MKTLDKYLLWAIGYIVAWSVVFFIAWCFKNQEPSVLEGCILAPGVVEMICGAVIKHGKTKYGGESETEPEEEITVTRPGDNDADETEDESNG